MGWKEGKSMKTGPWNTVQCPRERRSEIRVRDAGTELFQEEKGLGHGRYEK